MNKTIVELGDLRTDMESVKWDNMRKSVGTLLSNLHNVYRCSPPHSLALSRTLSLPGCHICDHGIPPVAKATSTPKSPPTT